MEQKEKQKFLKNPKIQIYVILACFSAFVLVFLVFFIFPCIQDIRKKFQELVLEKNNFAALASQVSEVEKFKANYANYMQDLQKIDRTYLDPKNPASFFEFLENAARVCNLSIEVSITTAGVEKDIESGFRVLAQGTFSDAIKFLEKLESAPYLLRVQDIDFKQSKTFEAVFNLKVAKNPNIIQQ